MEVDPIEQLVIEAEIVMKVAFDEKYVSNYIKSEDGKITGFLAQDFTLHYWGDPGVFYISFIVGTKCKRAADITLLLSTIINFEYLYVMEDFYWDYETSKMLFGDDAIHKKYQDYLKQRNKVECPMCAVVHPKRNISENGFCVVCDTLTDKLTWH